MTINDLFIIKHIDVNYKFLYKQKLLINMLCNCNKIELFSVKFSNQFFSLLVNVNKKIFLTNDIFMIMQQGLKENVVSNNYLLVVLYESL